MERNIKPTIGMEQEDESICTPEMHAKIEAAKAQFSEEELRIYEDKRRTS